MLMTMSARNLPPPPIPGRATDNRPPLPLRASVGSTFAADFDKPKSTNISHSASTRRPLPPTPQSGVNSAQQQSNRLVPKSHNSPDGRIAQCPVPGVENKRTNQQNNAHVTKSNYVQKPTTNSPHSKSNARPNPPVSNSGQISPRSHNATSNKHMTKSPSEPEFSDKPPPLPPRRTMSIQPRSAAKPRVHDNYFNVELAHEQTGTKEDSSFEERFRFHRVEDFPKPEDFTGRKKTYSSQQNAAENGENNRRRNRSTDLPEL